MILAALILASAIVKIMILALRASDSAIAESMVSHQVVKIVLPRKVACI